MKNTNGYTDIFNSNHYENFTAAAFFSIGNITTTCTTGCPKVAVLQNFYLEYAYS